MADPFPELRVRAANDAPIHADRDFVLYWMTSARRTKSSFPLQRAVEHAAELDLPLVILEALRCDYPWASDRLHRFVIEGMADNAADLEDKPVTYHPYVEPERGAGKGLLQALSDRAAVVVTDDFPCFFVPRMVAAAAERLDCRLEAVDGNGLLPMRAADKVFTTAHSFRRFLQKTLRPHLDERPARHPLSYRKLAELDGLPPSITERWPAAHDRLADPGALSDLPIDHDVGAAAMAGGAVAGGEALKRFTAQLDRYAEERNEPEADATSGLSPWLHFGHVGAHEVLEAVASERDWSPADTTDRTDGARRGWWGLDDSAEGFLDQLVTWRELGFNMCHLRDDHDRYESLPEWARETLEQHAGDPRPHLYDLDRFEAADTHDELWNAAQRQLVSEGRMHNYLRMLWGKKILHWSEGPRQALDIMIELNNKYAVDGRDPNSYSGIFWVLGRYDRAWGPEREVFGKIRYMTSANTARKLKVKDYVRRYGDGQQELEM